MILQNLLTELKKRVFIIQKIDKVLVKIRTKLTTGQIKYLLERNKQYEHSN